MKNYFKAITRPYSKKQKLKKLTPRTLNSEKEYRRLKRLLTHKKDNIGRTLKVTFRQPEKYYGWILLDMKTLESSITIRCSYAFEPFGSFVHWMIGIHYDNFLNSWNIEEEGQYKKLFVYPVDNIHLRLVVVDDDHYALNHCIYKNEHIVLDTVVRKEEFIAQFYYGFKNFVRNDFKQEKWSSDNLYEWLKDLDKYFDCNWGRWEGLSPYI